MDVRGRTGAVRGHPELDEAVPAGGDRARGHHAQRTRLAVADERVVGQGPDVGQRRIQVRHAPTLAARGHAGTRTARGDGRSADGHDSIMMCTTLRGSPVLGHPAPVIRAWSSAWTAPSARGAPPLVPAGRSTASRPSRSRACSSWAGSMGTANLFLDGVLREGASAGCTARRWPCAWSPRCRWSSGNGPVDVTPSGWSARSTSSTSSRPQHPGPGPLRDPPHAAVPLLRGRPGSGAVGAGDEHGRHDARLRGRTVAQLRQRGRPRPPGAASAPGTSTRARWASSSSPPPVQRLLVATEVAVPPRSAHRALDNRRFLVEQAARVSATGPS